MWDTFAMYTIIAMIFVFSFAIGLVFLTLMSEWLFGDIFERKPRNRKDPSK